MDVGGLIKKAEFNTKVTEIEGKISSITGLATNSELTPVENKIPDVNSLVKNTELNAKVIEIEGEISDASSLATNSALTTVENKIPNVASLITKTCFDVEFKKSL